MQIVRAVQKARLVKDMRSKNVRKMTGQKSEECAQHSAHLRKRA